MNLESTIRLDPDDPAQQEAFLRMLVNEVVSRKVVYCELERDTEQITQWDGSVIGTVCTEFKMTISFARAAAVMANWQLDVLKHLGLELVQRGTVPEWMELDKSNQIDDTDRYVVRAES